VGGDARATAGREAGATIIPLPIHAVMVLARFALLLA